jgi:hypothetical protein
MGFAAVPRASKVLRNGIRMDDATGKHKLMVVGGQRRMCIGQPNSIFLTMPWAKSAAKQKEQSQKVRLADRDERLKVCIILEMFTIII